MKSKPERWFSCVYGVTLINSFNSSPSLSYAKHVNLNINFTYVRSSPPFSRFLRRHQRLRKGIDGKCCMSVCAWRQFNSRLCALDKLTLNKMLMTPRSLLERVFVTSSPTSTCNLIFHSYWNNSALTVCPLKAFLSSILWRWHKNVKKVRFSPLLAPYGLPVHANLTKLLLDSRNTFE